jgi:hypothetical protein
MTRTHLVDRVEHALHERQPVAQRQIIGHLLQLLVAAVVAQLGAGALDQPTQLAELVLDVAHDFLGSFQRLHNRMAH